MTKLRILLSAGLMVVGALLSGCGGHEPLPVLRYNKTAPVLGSAAPDVPARVNLVTGSARGHSLTTYALMPGGWAMPITSESSSTGDFNAEDQAAFVENLVRVLHERSLLHRAAETEEASVTLTIKFLKTEHFPHMQDYVLDVLVTAQVGSRGHDKIYHVSTMDGVNLVARMFQHGIEGRRNAAELLLAAVVPDLEQWLTESVAASATKPGRDLELIIPQPYSLAAPGVVDFLAERYARPSTFWTGGINVHVARPSDRVTAIELRSADSVPPFCLVDLYNQGEVTRVVIREKDRLLSAKANVAEAVKEYIAGATAAKQESNQPL